MNFSFKEAHVHTDCFDTTGGVAAMGGPDRQTRVNHNAPSISQGNKEGKNFAPPGTNSFLDLTPL